MYGAEPGCHLLSVSVTGGLIGYTGHTNCVDEYAALLSNSVDVTFR
jgi:hypothetical protein